MRVTLSDLITVLVPTSPIPSHPSTAIIDETLGSIDAAGLDECRVIVMSDGVRPEQEDRAVDYYEYRERLAELRERRPNTTTLMFGSFMHQAAMTRQALDKVTTPLVLFVEHDTPLCGEIPWESMANAILASPCKVDVIRLHYEAQVLACHRYLMAGRVETLRGVPMWRTAQWSQRPHLASTSWYRAMLGRHFPPEDRTFIEDRIYGMIATPWVERQEWGAEVKLWLYHPEGNIKRSTHLDGREDQPKWD